ncbi:zinc-binding metallopeptidase family protein [Agromyces atrinae]|uniref:Zinc-ribbon domain-containing protein n=1 Tax=Agromyces atrinae TaxID=592376 RepID=A0A4Q2M142_9MICO|nr:putative zinc-binding metallopeptidase [Agromyces atrinae]NYD68372.1 hypothetical protein [Agromyces atrinae]RXZ85584.1 hypothetical protein ESP50_13870 [Agromyces atrinae]
MRIFACPGCSRVVYYDNLSCLACGTELAYDRENVALVAVVGERYRAAGGVRRRCMNTIAGCNWLTADDEASECFSCLLTRSRPVEGEQNIFDWLAETSHAKRWLIFQLDELGLPIVSHRDKPNGGLAFDLDATTDDHRVMIGHMNGVITIDLSEAQDSHREALRVLLGEAYRTMLGHFRHEIGHYYWMTLVASDPARLEAFRERFGDERQDYGQALTAHYSGGVAAWQHDHISQYATTHPWEDFAETFAHYLHICGTLQSAGAFGLSMAGPGEELGARGSLTSHPTLTPQSAASVRDILAEWQPLALALNLVNRSLGKGDLYPFTIADPVVEKLEYVHRLVSGR